MTDSMTPEAVIGRAFWAWGRGFGCDLNRSLKTWADSLFARRFRPARLGHGVAGHRLSWIDEGLRRRGNFPAQQESLAQLADICEKTREPCRELDIRIALAAFPELRLLARTGPGVWAHPDGTRVKALRYSSSSRAAMTLVPQGHRIQCSTRIVGRIEVYGPDQASAIASARNDYFPLAAVAAALRARGALECISQTGGGSAAVAAS